MNSRFSRWAALLAAFVLMLAACSREATDNPTTTTAAAEDAGVQTTATDALTVADPTGSSDDFDMTIAILEDLTTTNYWAYLDPENSVWNAYVFGNQAPALFQYSSPTLQLVPLVADGLPAEPVQDGVWTVTQQLKQGLTWSDGQEVTAADIVFTYETVRDLLLGGQWFSTYPIASDDDPATEESEANSGLIAVSGVDDYTVEYTFNQTPGLALWQFGVGLGPILPEHFWADAVQVPPLRGTSTPSTGWEPRGCGHTTSSNANPGHSPATAPMSSIRWPARPRSSMRTGRTSSRPMESTSSTTRWRRRHRLSVHRRSIRPRK